MEPELLEQHWSNQLQLDSLSCFKKTDVSNEKTLVGWVVEGIIPPTYIRIPIKQPV